MLRDFTEFNFTPICVTIMGEPEMQINKKYITFTRSLMGEMGFPEYVRLMTDAENKVFCIKSCKPGEPEAYRFCRQDFQQKEPKYCSSKAVRKTLFALMGDDFPGDESYRVRGTYYKDAQAMVFDLNEMVVRHILER